MDFSAHPLVETAWLEAHLSDDDLCLVDARWRGDGSSGELYQRGHLPGAVHLDWHHDVSWTDEHGVRDLLLPPEPFAAVMEAVGIGDQARVVAYAETDHAGAARLWWALRFYGHEQVAVLNGGWTKWVAEGRPVSTERAHPDRGAGLRLPANSDQQEAIERCGMMISLSTAPVVLAGQVPPHARPTPGAGQAPARTTCAHEPHCLALPELLT